MPRKARTVSSFVRVATPRCFSYHAAAATGLSLNRCTCMKSWCIALCTSIVTWSGPSRYMKKLRSRVPAPKSSTPSVSTVWNVVPSLICRSNSAFMSSAPQPM